MNQLIGETPITMPGGAGAAPPNALLGGPQAASPQQMLGPVLSRATDPTTGEVNYNKAFVGLASDAATAPLAVGFLEQASEKGATNVPVAMRSLESEYAKQKLISTVAGSLLPLGPNITTKELVQAISSPEFARAVPDPRTRASILASAPRGGVQLAQWVAAQAQAAEGGTRAMESVMGALHAKMATRALANVDPVGTLSESPGWIGRVARGFATRHPQVLEGPRARGKQQVLLDQIEGLKRQEGAARQHYATLARDGSPPFEEWWEESLAAQGLV